MAGLIGNTVLGNNDLKGDVGVAINEGRKFEGTRSETGEETEKDMAPAAGSSIHRSGSRAQLDVSGAAIQGNFEERDPTILLPNQSDDISHLALDIGDELIINHVSLLWRGWGSW
uniref:Uncharacterized protein n=1 Tax=Opuntia streptacantha TaxID=393608 RepID=A0A7C9DXE8_OPUST